MEAEGVTESGPVDDNSRLGMLLDYQAKGAEVMTREQALRRLAELIRDELEAEGAAEIATDDLDELAKALDTPRMKGVVDRFWRRQRRDN
jgi:hypothetical protein